MPKKKRPDPLDHVLVETQVSIPPAKDKLPGLEDAPTTRTEYRCSVCNLAWREKPTDACPGAKIYSWDPWPAGLLTKKQLAAKKLRPGPLAGVIPYDKSADGDGWLRLYRESEAVPRPALSPRRQAALDKMQAAAEVARHCSNCGDMLHDRRELFWGVCYDCQQAARHDSDRAEVAREVYELICQGDFVVWDSETTDLSGYFVEVAAVDQHGRVLFDQRIRPQALIEPGALAVHGIRDDKLVGCPTFWEVSGALRAVLHGRRWVGYNIDFDAGVLRAEMGRPDVRSYFERYPIKPSETFDVMSSFATFYGEWHNYWKSYTWQKLDTAAGSLGVQVDLPAHSALGDCLRTLGVLYEMADWYRKEYLS